MHAACGVNVDNAAPGEHYEHHSACFADDVEHHSAHELGAADGCHDATADTVDDAATVPAA